jgi:FAD dependent oxidoreductase TIGR03364
MDSYDLAIVGGGIIGLSHAYAAQQKGLRVLLIEKNEKCVGASIRNFGLIWPVGQPAGPTFDKAMKSRELWLKLSREANFWCLENGSLHLAYQDDEMNVLEEYHKEYGYNTELLNVEQVLKFAKQVNRKGLLGGLYSPLELNVNPREAIYSITDWLQGQDNCDIRTDEKVLHAQTGRLCTTKQEYRADYIFVCSGSDFKSLFADEFRESNLVNCKLQMMRSTAQHESFRLGPTLCAGLTLRHYASFRNCRSLNALKERFHREMKAYEKWGIHVMVSQNQQNQLIIGDSHEYGYTFDPFNKKEINDHIIDYMKRFLNVHPLKIEETWYGVYSKNPAGTFYVSEPDKNVRIITGFGGAGMTLSFGHAIEELDNL